jgi:ATP-dependent helicase/nuclease subunit A
MKELSRLLPAQARAADPAAHAWVSASAGTGKTQVLSARVLRLLLSGVPAANILCITFTKLAAAEMQERVLSRLAYWARADEAGLAADLEALGEAADEAARARARRLFAQLLDGPQGLAVQTIHAFAQSLIGSFPVEAGVAPGFATLDDRAGQGLRRDVLRHAIEAATADGDTAFLDDVAVLALNGGEAGLMRMLGHIGRHAEALAGLARVSLEPMLRRGFGLPSDLDAADDLAAALTTIDRDAVVRLAEGWANSPMPSVVEFAEGIAPWLANSSDWMSLRFVFLTKDGKLRSDKKTVLKGMEDADPGLKAVFNTVAAEILVIDERQRLHRAVEMVAVQMRVARRLASDWLSAKARAGVVDYDDMIEAARRLLAGKGAADWVRYKLDSRIDHILVDEAQDTNDAQWEIIEALSEEFFSGVGAREAARRMFVVGDFKQAIYSFQGSDPKVYDSKRIAFGQFGDDAGQPFAFVGLDTNFRSVPAVLDIVDDVAKALDEEATTRLEPDGFAPHRPHRREGAGAVVLMPPTEPAAKTADADEDAAENVGDEWSGDADVGERVGQAEIDHAQALAKMIARWRDPHDPLILPARGRPVAAQDILVLVRKRTAFSAALVAALHSHGVPVAGVDRLKLSEPLAVADMLSLVHFVLLPDDDLNLACLMVSPFLGLDHEALFALAHGRSGSLWSTMRASSAPPVVAAREWLEAVLGFADFSAPYEFFERVLSGPLQGRKRLLARLGEEARDAIDTMLDQALAFERLQAPSLQGFLAWTLAEDIEIKRDPDAPLDAVRLMTVHGAKGLQAPVVVLADAARVPDLRGQGALMMEFDGQMLPLLPPSKSALGGMVPGRLGAALDAARADALSEHLRLLYVALTRAEDLLVVSGVKPKEKKKPGEHDHLSWHRLVAAAMDGRDIAEVEDLHFSGQVRAHRTGAPVAKAVLDLTPAAALRGIGGWALRMAPEEARPPRPLSPSALAPDTHATPPAGPAAAAAARRGAALHALFERLPDVPPGERRALGLAYAARLLPDGDAAAMVDEVLRVLDNPVFADVFGAGSLAEAPVVAVVGETVIAGQVDRLLVEPERVRLVDFKTGRRVPARLEDLPEAHVAQMAGYVAALRTVFPGRAVEVALLYTAGPTLWTVPEAMLAAHDATLDPKRKAQLNAGAPMTILPDDGTGAGPGKQGQNQ